MNIIEAIQRRHSVRQYLEKEIPEEIVERLLAAMRACNQVGGLHMHLVLHEPEAFSGLRSKAMRFRGVENYIILAGEKDDTLEERCGYYGEKVVLLAQQLGLNTCWVGSTFKKKPECYNLAPGEKVVAATAGSGFYTKLDLGIVKCHFEIGAGKDNFQWMPEDM